MPLLNQVTHHCVGAGNGAIYVDATVIDRAVEDLLLSKRFDNGMICYTKLQSLKLLFT